MFEVEPDVFLPIDVQDDVVYWAFADGSRSWDAAMHLSRSVIRPGDIVVDVGAHIGVWTLGAARRAGPGGCVHAFEPVPRNAERLRRNLELNKIEWVRILSSAVSDRTGRTSFALPGGSNMGMGSLGAPSMPDLAIEVEVTTLDAYCRQAGINRVAVLKVDAEGAEERVFRGGVSCLAGSESPVVMFEADEALLRALDSSTTAVAAVLEQLGYRVFRATSRALLPLAPLETVWGEDLLALKPHHFEQHPELRVLFEG